MIDPKLLFPFSLNSDTSRSRVIESYKQFSYIDNGKDILDLGLGNAGCFMLGFDRQDIIEYVCEKMVNNPFVSGEYMTTNADVLELTEKLYELSNGYKSVFSLSGSDAVEGAIKIASMFNSKQKIIGFKDSYHGSTFLSSSIGNIDYMTKYWNKYENCIVLDSYDLSTIEQHMKDAFCLVIESCSWNKGLEVLPDSFWKELRDLCTINDVVLIVDDIAMCGGKTGSFFGYNKLANPDIVCLGKSFSGGYFPLSACLVSPVIHNLVKDMFFAHGFTYSFSLSGIYSTLKYIDILEKEQHLQNFQSVFNRTVTLLEDLTNAGHLKGFRNNGLVFELLTKPVSEDVYYNNGINIGIWNNSNDKLLLVVPINANTEYFDKLYTRLQNALDHL